ncbi:MAG: hypothetical protein IJV49_03855 [Aeriscardovia sp.]|nr:hypothetical protein [Aeriscardovia sp.]
MPLAPAASALACLPDAEDEEPEEAVVLDPVEPVEAPAGEDDADDDVPAELLVDEDELVCGAVVACLFSVCVLTADVDAAVLF